MENEGWNEKEMIGGGRGKTRGKKRREIRGKVGC